FDLDKAEALYKGPVELKRLLDRDDSQFQKALTETGSPLPTGTANEPINLLAQRYEQGLSFHQAAADVYLQDAADFQRRIARSSELEAQGFGQLQGAAGG